MNPQQIESQIHGGIVMGISFAPFENRILDHHTGRMVNAVWSNTSSSGYETPAIYVALLENYQAISATDA